MSTLRNKYPSVPYVYVPLEEEAIEDVSPDFDVVTAYANWQLIEMDGSSTDILLLHSQEDGVKELVLLAGKAAAVWLRHFGRYQQLR